MSRLLALLAALALLVAACADDDPAIDEAPAGDDTPAAGDDPAEDDDTAGSGYEVVDQPAEAAASFVTPADGDTTTSPVSLEMAAEGVEVVKADAPAVGQGHFHVAVDAGCTDEGEFIPGPGEEAQADGYHHFGDGSTEGELELEPGTYELCLQLADGVHQAFGESDTVTITVE